MFGGDRRMEAETYLSTGFALRQAIEAQPKGWCRFGDVARVWMPGRLKGIQVKPQLGTPFLAATQVFDARPIPRKWLALQRTADARNRYVADGQILVTCSGAVGRPTIGYSAHANTLISHDLLRVDALESKDRGWIYAYLHAPQVRAMALGAHYGHIIKHLEPEHLQDLPLPLLDDETSKRLLKVTSLILELRNKAYQLTLEAEARFERALGNVTISDWGTNGFVTRASEAFLSKRRRLEASVHNPGVVAIRRHLDEHGEGWISLSQAEYEIWLPKRFKRVPASDGVWMLDSADLSEVNPDLSKRIADGDFGDKHGGRVKAGWVLMARSGQTYGIIGTALLAGKGLEGHVISDHVMRIRPKENAKIHPGYLVTAMSHPVLGRPLVKALAYGSSIPEIDPADISAFQVVRLEQAEEKAIGQLAEKAAHCRSEADILERAMAVEAGEIIARFTEAS